MAGENARRSIGESQTRNAEPQHTADIAGLTLIGPGIFPPIVDQRELFRQRHPAEQTIDTHVARDQRAGAGERGRVQQRSRQDDEGARYDHLFASLHVLRRPDGQDWRTRKDSNLRPLPSEGSRLSRKLMD